jgi:anti-sigma factor RsiW
MTDHDHDSELVALIDNELEGDTRARLLARLAEDEAMRKRYDALREAGRLMVIALDALLQEAPLPQLRACLPPEAPRCASSARFAGIVLRGLAAGIAVCLLAAGAGAWIAMSLAPGEGKKDWRSAVEEYTNLYTNETFSPLHPDAPLQAIELSAVGARVGVNLTPEGVELPGLRFTVAFMLSYKGSPLAAIAYVDAEGSPVMFCIIANEAPDAPMRLEQRDELSLASWSRGGRGYLVIGRIPEERAVAFAETLEKRI